MSYYTEKMWCRACKDYVHYLQSTDSSYCARCGAKVQFFNEEDVRRIRKILGVSPSPRKKSKAS